MYVQVVLSKVSPQTDKEYTYKIPAESTSRAAVGIQVLIPFGRAKAVGYITAISKEAPAGVERLKEILEIRTRVPLFSRRSVETAKWISFYYCCLFGSALRLFLPPGIEAYEKTAGKRRIEFPISPSTGLGASNFPLDRDRGKQFPIPKEQTKKDAGKPVLLFNAGLSERTGTYIKEAQKTLSENRGVILLLPEIGHDNRFVEEFKKNFGDIVAVIHSNMTEKERFCEWERLYLGKAKIAIGTRSAIFAPVHYPGLIIVEDENEFTYKSEQTPKYHVRDTALFMAEKLSARLILSSSSPSVESFFRAQNGKYFFSEKDQIVNDSKPEILVVDTKEERSRQLSSVLKEEIARSLDEQKPVMLIQNRRGYAPFLVCGACGNAIECPNCSLSLTYHSPDGTIRCHRCGFLSEKKIVCPKCFSHSINYFGAGTQKIESEIGKLFPKVRTIRIDRDNLSSKKNASIALEAFVKDEAQVLIGTQMVLKALPKKKFGLVAVISADAALNSPDFRAAESAFDFLFRITAGDNNAIPPDRVVIQTLNPQHYAVTSAVEGDYKKFYATEIMSRKDFGYPPFSFLINVILSGKDREAVRQEALQICSQLKAFDRTIEILGPVKAPLEKLRGMVRYQMLIKGQDLAIIKSKLKEMVAVLSKNRQIRLSVDVDPVNLG
ncbi:MAG: primosomal protein N' [Candidatus Margulisiibacteriota bacterium]